MPKFTTISTKSKTSVRIAALLTVLVGVSLAGYFFVIIPMQTLSGDNVGKLEPTEPPGSLSYGLEDIYNKLVYGKNADLSQKKSAPASAPSDTQVTLDNIYQNIPPADKICKGVNAGTVECGGGAVLTPTPSPVQTETPAPTETPTPTQTPSPIPVAQENLVLWLPFNETSGSKFIDSSSQQNNGICVWGKCPVIGKVGKVDKAVEFDGTNNYVKLSKKFSFLEGVTTEAWVNFKSIASGPQVSTIYSSGYQNKTSNGYHFFYLVQYPSNEPLLAWQWAVINNHKVAYSYVPLNLDEWYHLVVTHDYHANKITFYVNGTYVGEYSSSAEPVIQVSDQDGFLGSYNGGAHFLNGFLDDVKIYNKALSGDEVDKEYNSYQ